MEILDLIAKAVESGNVEQLEVLERIHAAEVSRIEREKAAAAKASYHAAMLEFRGAILTVAKTSTADIVRQGKKVGEYNYLSIDQMVDVVVPELTKAKIIHSWDTITQNGSVLVKCKFHHEGGHEEESTVHLPMDTSGAKNDAQAVCSAITYGERYSFMAVGGLAAGGQDNDAADVQNAPREAPREEAAAPVTISETQVSYLKGLVTQAGVPMDKVLETCNIKKLADLTHQDAEKLKKKLLTTIKANRERS